MICTHGIYVSDWQLRELWAGRPVICPACHALIWEAPNGTLETREGDRVRGPYHES